MQHRVLLLMLCFGLAQASELRILSWNIWFDDASGVQRYPAIAASIAALAPDVACLQEVTPASLAVIRRELTPAWQLTLPARVDGYFNVVLTRQVPTESGELRLPSAMGRTVPWCRIAHGNHSVVMASIHLESLDREPSPQRRVWQWQLIEATLAPPFIAAGDANTGDADSIRFNLGPSVVDAGAVFQDATATYDPQSNSLAAETSDHAEPARRLDRVLLVGVSATVSSYRVITSGLSDHEAIEVDIDW